MIEHIKGFQILSPTSLWLLWLLSYEVVKLKFRSRAEFFVSAVASPGIE